jgi:hypothetical protein
MVESAPQSFPGINQEQKTSDVKCQLTSGTHQGGKGSVAINKTTGELMCRRCGVTQGLKDKILDVDVYKAAKISDV